jgi:hypothetical protein
MTLMGACAWCRRDKPTHTPIQRQRLYRARDGLKLCMQHYAKAMEGDY